MKITNKGCRNKHKIVIFFLEEEKTKKDNMEEIDIKYD